MREARAMFLKRVSILAVGFGVLLVAPDNVRAAGTLTITSAPGLTVQEGTAISGTVATFSDTNAVAAGDFNVTINWGDGTPTIAGTVSEIGGAGGTTYNVTGTHTYADEGSYVPRFTVSEISNPSNTDSATSSSIVADAPLTFSSLSISFAPLGEFLLAGSFTDANPLGTAADFSTTINWGDGSSSAGTVTETSPGMFGVSGSHIYLTGGSDTISLTTRDDGGSSASFELDVVPPTPIPEPSSLTLLGTGLLGLAGMTWRKKLFAYE